VHNFHVDDAEGKFAYSLICEKETLLPIYFDELVEAYCNYSFFESKNTASHFYKRRTYFLWGDLPIDQVLVKEYDEYVTASGPIIKEYSSKFTSSKNAELEISIENAFDQLDRSADGKLEKGEIATFFENLYGKKLDEVAFEKVFNGIDLNKDGKIEWHEFKTYLTNLLNTPGSELSTVDFNKFEFHGNLSYLTKGSLLKRGGVWKQKEFKIDVKHAQLRGPKGKVVKLFGYDNCIFDGEYAPGCKVNLVMHLGETVIKTRTLIAPTKKEAKRWVKVIKRVLNYLSVNPLLRDIYRDIV